MNTDVGNLCTDKRVRNLEYMNKTEIVTEVE